MLDTRDTSILTQVAFKGAVEYAVGRGIDLTTENGSVDFGVAFNLLQDELFSAVETRIPVRSAAEVEAVISRELGGVPVVDSDGYALRVKGEQHGPLPSWLIEAAAAKGVNEVWDNRAKIANGSMKPNGPHFKATSADIPFWPPKGK
jgi:hypothetical protein